MIRALLFLLLVHGGGGAANAARNSRHAAKWQTLSGEPPAIIARGGFSGIFPDSSQYAYQYAQSTSVKNLVLFCDIQLTKDGQGFCSPDLRLENSTTIRDAFPDARKTYTVRGKDLRGWFSIDFTGDQIYNNVTLVQNIYTRPDVFDRSLPISTVEDVAGLHPFQFWINVEDSSFFAEHDLDAVNYLRAVSKNMTFDYISSPEIDFLKSVGGALGKKKPKLIFKFLEKDETEPSTKKTYRELLSDLPAMKPVAAGILVPKDYIWPVRKDQYLEALPTFLVADAHKLGLEVYVYTFRNDILASNNYSFDPAREYLQFIDNADFAVDGLLSDFPSTASEAVACLAHHMNKPLPDAASAGRPLIITHNGASGMFAGCTDLAYEQAVNDGADVIDCSVQMSKDGVAFCMESPDLMRSTTAITTFMPRAASIPELKKDSGIFSFDLTWKEIQSLKPELTSKTPQLRRNPAAKNAGKFMTLDDFLQFAKASTVSGVLIDIENAAFLASKKGLGVVDSVTSALAKASLDKKKQTIYIQSGDTSVLSAFKAHQRVLRIEEIISDAPRPTVDEIKKVAVAVNLPRASVVTRSGSFVLSFTEVVEDMHAAKISVFISNLRNEFTAIAFDYFSDPYIEISTYVGGAGVDGVVTEFPATAAAFFRSPCSDPKANLPYTFLPIEPGSLLSLAPPDVLPPAQAPAPALEVADVDDPPLPPIVTRADDAQAEPAPTGPTSSPNGQPASYSANVSLCLLMLMLSFLALRHH